MIRFPARGEKSFPLHVCSAARHAPGWTERFGGLAGAMPKFTPERWATDTADLDRALVKDPAWGF